MSSSAKRPWHMYFKVIIGAVAVILAAVLGAFVMHWLNSPTSEFTVSLNPMMGNVQKGGVLETQIRVKNIRGYEDLVNLSYENLPAGVVVTLSPPSTQQVPPYESKMILSVGSEATPGDYALTIRGVGADGIEARCTYSLTVTPSPGPLPLQSPPPDAPFVVYSDIGISGGDVWSWSGEEFGKQPLQLFDLDYASDKAPEGVTCCAAISGSGSGNYVGWGVFHGIFNNKHELLDPHTVDLSGYKRLQFWVKTAANLKTEIQQDNQYGNKSYACMIGDYGWQANSADMWQQVTIPAKAFRGIDLSKVFCPFMITGKGSNIAFFVDDVRWVP